MTVFMRRGQLREHVSYHRDIDVCSDHSHETKTVEGACFMSQGAEKSQPPKVGIEPGPQDLKANTLPRRCKSRLLPQGSRSVLYTYTYYIFPCFKLIRPRIYSEPRVIPGHFLLSDARNTSRGPHILATKCHRVQKNPNRPRWESNLGRRI